MPRKRSLNEFLEIFSDDYGGSEPPSARVVAMAMAETLTEHQRQLVREYYFDGDTVYKIAERHGISPPAVSRTLKRARKQLYSALKYSMGRRV